MSSTPSTWSETTIVPASTSENIASNPPGRDAIELGDVAVEGGEEEVLVGNEQNQRHRSGDHCKGHQVSGGNPR